MALGLLRRRAPPLPTAARLGRAHGSLSIGRGPSEPPLYAGTIPQHFAGVVAAHGDRPAVVARAPGGAERSLSYAGLDALSNRLAASLQARGVRKGARVAVALGNGLPFAALTYGLYKLGAVLVPLNPALGAAQVRAALRTLDAEVLVVAAVADRAYRPGAGRCNRGLVEAVLGAAPERLGARIACDALPALRHVVVVDNRADHGAGAFAGLDACAALTPYAALVGDGAARPVRPAAPLAAGDTINVQFTSGTTSAPKAAMLTHASMLNNGALVAHRMGLAPADRVVVPPPLFHCFGSVLGFMATATTGAALLLPSPAFDPAATLRMCADGGATGLYGVGTMFAAVLDALDAGAAPAWGPAARARLRKGIVAGSSVAPALLARVRARLGLADVVICYGMTETGPVTCMTAPTDPPAARARSVGRPLPHTAVKIVAPTDRARVQPRGVRGELAAAGYCVMQGYWGDAARTAAVRVAEPDGAVWMYSGDEAVMDAAGFVTITGRIKDLIIRAGENIHPLEVEDCLFQHPAVHEASVVGVPDDRLGEAVAAFVVRRRDTAGRDAAAAASSASAYSASASSASASSAAASSAPPALSEDDVRAWVRARLSSHLVPKHVFWIDDFPKTASGKIQKYKLRELAVDALKHTQHTQHTQHTHP